MACNAERNAYITLKSELTDLQEQLKRAATPQKSALIQQINALRPQVAAAQHVYEVCAAAHPPPVPLSARFQGNCGSKTSYEPQNCGACRLVPTAFEPY